MDEMTVKVVLKNKRTVYVYEVRDEHEGLGLAHILEARLERSRGKLKDNKIEAWRFFDSDSVYHIRQRMNGDWEIKTKF